MSAPIDRFNSLPCRKEQDPLPETLSFRNARGGTVPILRKPWARDCEASTYSFTNPGESISSVRKSEEDSSEVFLPSKCTTSLM